MFRIPMILATSLVLASVPLSVADSVKLQGGKVMECDVIQDTPKRLLLIYEDGLVVLGRGMVESVTHTKVSEKDTSTTAVRGRRIPGWEAIVKAVAEQPWGSDVVPIPATVIDVGVLKNVPYKSQRCAEKNCEFNVYGDPANPAGFELGVLGPLLKDEAAKKRCIDLVAGLLLQPTDRSIVRALQIEEDKVARNDWTFEITPPTAEDAYGGWWISVYNEKLLEGVRATEKELSEIAVSKADAAKSAPKPKDTSSKPDDVTSRSGEELQQARTASSGSSTSGGRVYVRGYHRKDGTYVRPHTRKR